ncbi:MAG: hypothetical protein JTT16_00465 [Candidatus Brockarchaeota archaeon]|nr:hypothetical protein [Candidatus Brockarchaeota archaeon]MBO3767780.1 hypothetical protein [Candidatus Brockarchaeota archaeon]MBO3801098.1 hypothetical protein [Candidatus Brockarchaeota archaeon]
MKRKKLREIYEDVDDFLDLESTSKNAKGYSVFVTTDAHGRRIVKVILRGNVNKEEVRKELMKEYPNAKIIGLDNEPLEEEI